MIDTLNDYIIHDLKNPLSGISTAAQLFLEGTLGELTPEQKKYMGTIGLSTKMTLDMLFDLSTIDKIESNQFSANKSTFSAGKLVENISWLTDYAKRDEKFLEINSGGNIQINADEILITRVLENLVLNAVKQASRGGKAILNISKAGDKTGFEVIDFGGEVPKELLDKIFEKNFKIDNQKYKSRIGASLGFYFCKLALGLHDSKIGSESYEGKGLKVRFSL